MAPPPRIPDAAECAAALSALPTVQTSYLSNGVRVASEYTPNREFCNIGVWIDAGSRFETLENNGVAHFLEHMNFKGSPKYTKKDIDTLFEHNGSHFNAYTARDRTAYYVKAFNKHVMPCMQLVSDILINSKLDPRYVEAERPTILAEMREVESLVDEVIMDNLHLSAFDPRVSGLPLTILGPVRNVAKSIDRTMLRKYVDDHYTGPRMNLVCSGGMRHEEVEKVAEACLGWLPSTNNRPEVTSAYTGGDYAMWNGSMMTANLAWAIQLPGSKHPDCLTMCVAQGLIGGYRREFGQVFTHMGRIVANARNAQRFAAELEVIQPFFTPYEETSLLGFYYVTVPSESNPHVLTQMAEDNMHQLQRLASELVDRDVLERVKAHHKATVLLAADGTTNRGEEIGRQLIQTGRVLSYPDFFAQLDAITPEVLRDTVAKYITDARPTVSLVGSPSALKGYDAHERLRATLTAGFSS